MCAANTSNSLGVDVTLESNAPHCPHGPTLLFERFTNKRSRDGSEQRQRYYACSACRDRKHCNFFQPADEVVSEVKSKMRQDSNRVQQPWKSHTDFYKRMEVVRDLSQPERRFCQDCSLLLYPNEASEHNQHCIKCGLTNDILQQPSRLLVPIENNKTNAQYLFSKKSNEFLISSIKELGFQRVLCVGVPRLHEVIQMKESLGLSSILLDIDHRYGQFYPPELFCRYNMFNNYFFEGDQSRATCEEFLHCKHGEDVLMVIDPPFGGRVEILADVIKQLMEWWKEGLKDQSSSAKLSVMWIFPYFLEHRITASLPSFVMLDYKVEYDNHPLFQHGKKSCKKGSPVRIFTNLKPSRIVLPAQDGYRFCQDCDRYVSRENRHCNDCKSCTSKDGSTYKHCQLCKRCTKPAYVHCSHCHQCQLADHQCNITKIGCHICGSLDHKRKDCSSKLHRDHRYKKYKRK